MTEQNDPTEIARELTTEIVCAYVGNNHVASGDLADLIGTVFRTLTAIGTDGPGTFAARSPAELVPAVPIRKSVTPDHIICLEDGKAFKSLKRHLATRYGLTPAEYRAKWRLPADYPMVAANYAARRSDLARSMGLGRKSRDGARDVALSDDHP